MASSQGPDDLQVSNLPDPTPKDDEYLVQVQAAAANFFDILQIQGKYQNQPRKLLPPPPKSQPNSFRLTPLPAFPWIAGAEFAGTVIATPRGSSSGSGGGGGARKAKFPPGTRVFGASQGAFATKLCAREEALLAVPEGWSFREAAGLFVTAPTSYAALVVRAGIKKGDVVLVHAAAGGVGLAAVQGELLLTPLMR